MNTFNIQSEIELKYKKNQIYAMDLCPGLLSVIKVLSC